MDDAKSIIVPITDDYMFCHVFEDVEKCKELLERVLGIEIDLISPPVYQKEIRGGINEHGIRLDIYVKDVDGNTYDIEMQTYVLSSLGKRIRYYHSEMDGEMLKRGEGYDQLRKNIVIFFCCYGDPFGKNRSVYTFNTICKEDNELILDDEVLSIILWPGGSYEGIDGKLANVLNYINTGETSDEFTTSIANKTIELSKDDAWRSGYMTYQQRLHEEHMRGYTKGEADAIFSLVQDGLLEVSVGAERLKVTISDFETQMVEAGYKVPVIK